MVIHNLDSIRPVIRPDKADTVPVVDTDAVLPSPLSSERFQTITGRYAQVDEADCRIELLKLSGSHLPELPWATSPCGLGVPPVENILNSSIVKCADHSRMIARFPCYGVPVFEQQLRLLNGLAP
jgi:hypothetical protein